MKRIGRTAKDAARFKKSEENDRVYMYLAGLDWNIYEVRGRTLARKPLPSIHEVFSEVRREESRRRVMLNAPKSFTQVEGSGLATKGFDPDGDRKKKPWCKHCKKPWHTKDTCWKIHGKPANFKKKSNREGSAFQTTIEGVKEQSSSAETTLFTKEQLEHL